MSIKIDSVLQYMGNLLSPIWLKPLGNYAATFPGQVD